MKTYRIDKKKYYLASDLMATHPSFFKGCRTVKSITKKDRLPQNKYVFARKISDRWSISKGDSKKVDKLFISKKWYNDNYSDKKDKIEIEPNLMHLEEKEMFTDNDGNLIDIEARGEREFDKCYFKVKDIADGCGLKNLRKVIINKDSSFIKDVHYKYFYTAVKNDRTRKLYLTCSGLLKVLFGSRNKIADKIVQWVLGLPFITQMDHKIQKQQPVPNLVDISGNSNKPVFNRNIYKIPCIYLFYINEVKNLRESLNIDKYDDDDYVCKWGMTIDIERRKKDHERTYGKLKLLIFVYVNPQYISEAEIKIKHLFECMDYKLDHHKYKEIAIIPKNKMKLIKRQYVMISKLYLGYIKELINK